MKHYGDIKTLSGFELPVVDVISGGSPCQDLSVAGTRSGLAGKRSGLFMEQMRIIREMREHDRDIGRTGVFVRPRYMVWENVPGAYTSGSAKGADFAAVLEEIIKVCEPSSVVRVRIPDGGWTKSGCFYSSDGRWSVAWRLHDAQFWGTSKYVDGRMRVLGTPQRRKRIALVADFGGLTAPEILFERKGMSWDSAESGDQREGAPGGAEECSAIAIEGNGARPSHRGTGIGTGGVSFTLNSVEQHSVYDPKSYTLKIRGGAERDSSGRKAGKGALVQTELSGTVATSQDQTLIQTNAKPFNKARNDQYEEDDVCMTVMARYGTGGNNTPIVSTNVYENHSQDSRYNPLGDVCETVSAKYGTGGNNMPIAVSVGNGQLNQMSMSEQANTLDTMHDQQAVLTSVVRRLTPLECERLQGFPDDWSKYGMTEDGTVYELSDSARYKMQGNSIARPFWTWMLRRLAAQYERTATLGSLFDGQAGFPLCWTEAGGIPVWSSEIERHPQAVARYHFPEDET